MAELLLISSKLIGFTFNNIQMTNATKYHSDDLLNFPAIYEAQTADKGRMLRMTFSLCNR